jgi:hypothetical protein
MPYRAAELGRILISHDRKMMPAHFARFIDIRSGSGLIIVPLDLDIGFAIEDLPIVWAASDAEEWRDKIGFLPL